MNKFLIKQVLSYLLSSRHKYGHGIHSPFVYDFIRNVLRNRQKDKSLKIIERQRKRLLQDTRELSVTDFGAGSMRIKNNVRKVCDIASSSLSTKKNVRLLYNIVKRYKPENIIELGTSLGISTSYLAYANKQSNIISLEGSEQIASVAKETMKFCDIKNVKIITGNFNDTLLLSLQELKKVDFVFVDGNHTKESTLNYFEEIYPYCSDKTIIIFDDISWSEGMHEAWQSIIADNRVTISIDLCKQGIVFFREGIVKQNFVIRY